MINILSNTTMFNFCTLFDQNYLSKGLALFESLNRYCDKINIYVLCLDDFTFYYLNQSKIENIITISLEELENYDKKLLAIKPNRTLVEYYFTISPCLPLFLLKINPELKWICSLDADIYFYNSPELIFEDFEEKYSILITPHKFTKELLKRRIERHGLYNVSFQAFKNNEVGLKCLEKWRLECLNWCGNYYDAKNQCYADQKYLDTWLIDFPNQVKVLDDSTTGLAIWNINNYTIGFQNNQLTSNGQRLIFYHFHKLNIINKNWVQNGFALYKVKRNKQLDNKIYKPYINLLADYESQTLSPLKTILNNKMPVLNLIKSEQFFYRFKGKLLIRINTRFLLISYSFLKKLISNK